MTSARYPAFETPFAFIVKFSWLFWPVIINNRIRGNEKEVVGMESKKGFSWVSVIVVIAFCVLSGLGAGVTVTKILHRNGGWIIPAYAMVAGIFTALSAVILAYVLSLRNAE